MRVVHLRVERFRGIRSLDWHLDDSLICLIGPGDTCKTSILDAIDAALSRRWSLTFTDADFFECDSSQPIVIDVTVADVPTDLLTEDGMGLHLRGYTVGEPVLDDPEAGTEPVLTIRLTVSADLEPTWTLCKGAAETPRRVGSSERSKLPFARLGDETVRDLTWGRNSALSRLTQDATGRASHPGLAEGSRAAMEAIGKSPPKRFSDAAKDAEARARDFGVPVRELRPGMDPQSISIGMGAISLFDGPVPLRLAGLGSRRLLVFALQEAHVKSGAVLLVDEVETGLDPHRLRHLLRHLRDSTAPRPHGAVGATSGQVILSTHSETALRAIPANHYRFVHRTNGEVRVTRLSSDALGRMRALAQRTGEPFLAPRVLVCEGQTEAILIRGMDAFWAKRHDRRSLGYQGVALADGSGAGAPRLAQEFATLGYDVCLFGDSDRPIRPSAAELRAARVAVFQWDGCLSTEERALRDLPLATLRELLSAVIRRKHEHSVCRAVGEALGRSLTDAEVDLDGWIAASGEDAVRVAMGVAAKGAGGKWFKDGDGAEELVAVIARDLPTIQDTPLAATLRAVEAWVHER